MKRMVEISHGIIIGDFNDYKLRTYLRIQLYSVLDIALNIISKHNKSANGNATFLLDDRYLLPYPL